MLRRRVASKGETRFELSPYTVFRVDANMIEASLRTWTVCLNASELIIATDDAASNAKLSGEWPADAFTEGVKPIVKQAKDTPRHIIIKGVELRIAMDIDYVLSQLRDQHAFSPVRIINKKTGQPTANFHAQVLR